MKTCAWKTPSDFIHCWQFIFHFLTALLSCKSHAISFIHWDYAVLWFLVNSQGCANLCWGHCSPCSLAVSSLCTVLPQMLVHSLLIIQVFALMSPLRSWEISSHLIQQPCPLSPPPPSFSVSAAPAMACLALSDVFSSVYSPQSSVLLGKNLYLVPAASSGPGCGLEGGASVEGCSVHTLLLALAERKWLEQQQHS